MNTDLFGDVSTADTGERSAGDFYETPKWMVRSLIAHHPIAAGAPTIFEPCSGRDAITDVLRAAGCPVLTNDIDRGHPAMMHLDASDPATWQEAARAFDHSECIGWTVTNPPFDVAFEILKLAYEHSRLGVALLLRKTFLEPTKGRKVRGVFIEGRGPWLAAHPPTRIIGEPRYSFRGDGSDTCAADWFIWEKGPRVNAPPIVIDHLAESRGRGGSAKHWRKCDGWRHLREHLDSARVSDVDMAG